MTTVYLFQVDSAKENRPFFEGMRDSSPESVYFRGLDFNVGPWTPDGVRVDLEMAASQPRCSLVLIELEAAEPTALRSSRKYLHENSIKICSEFMLYLNRVIKDCESRADPLEPKIALLMDVLGQNVPIEVKTAAALRSSTTFLEESQLIDQPSLAGSHETPHRYIARGCEPPYSNRAESGPQTAYISRRLQARSKTKRSVAPLRSDSRRNNSAGRPQQRRLS